MQTAPDPANSRTSVSGRIACVRVITWNMAMAGVSRGKPGLHDQAWHYLLGLGPDLALLQEALPPGWVRNEGAVIHGPFSQWGSVVFSARFPLQPFRLPQGSHLRVFGSYLALAEVSLPDGTDSLVASVHAVAAEATGAQLGSLDPTKIVRPSLARPRVNDVVFACLEQLVRDRSFIVAGDWNTARGQSSKRGRKAGEEFFDRAGKRGWYDCVWERVGEDVQTWYRKGSHIVQDDHAFCDRALGNRLRDIRVAADAAEHLRLSDHAPLILDFHVPPISMASRGEQLD